MRLAYAAIVILCFAVCAWEARTIKKQNAQILPPIDHDADEAYADMSEHIPHVTRGMVELTEALNSFSYRDSARSPIRFVSRRTR